MLTESDLVALLGILNDDVSFLPRPAQMPHAVPARPV